MDIVRLRDRQEWSAHPGWPPGLPQPEEVCAAVVIHPEGSEVVLHLNPDSACSWAHLPRDAQRAVDAFIDLGPDAGWDRLGDGSYATTLVPGEPGATGSGHTGRPRPSVEELERDLHFGGQ